MPSNRMICLLVATYSVPLWNSMPAAIGILSMMTLASRLPFSGIA